MFEDDSSDPDSDSDDDPLPDPATIGGLRRLIWELGQIRDDPRWMHGSGDEKYVRATRRLVGRLHMAIVRAPGYNALKTYLNTTPGLGQNVTVAALDEVIRRLAGKLKQDFDVVERYSIVEAQEILCKPPVLERSGEKSPKAAAPKRRLKSGEAALKICAALESLAAHGEWDAAEAEIYTRAKVSKTTYYRMMETNDYVRRATDLYHSKRLGRGPVRSRDI